ncbi:mitochondrial import inner membrane translocase subunit TIM44-like isoform X2 [Gordionus sp. m RMFG-2023]
MKETLKKFREESRRLENSESLQQVRQKYQKLEKDTLNSSNHLKYHLETLRDKIQESFEEAQKSDFTKKAIELSEEITKQVKGAADTASKAGKTLGSTEAYKAISDSVKMIKEEIDDQTSMHSMYYRPLAKLRKRKEYSEHLNDFSNKIFDPNKDATDMVMHKDSKWYQSWQNWKDNNPYINKIFDLKTKYDESDSVVVRASRFVTDKIYDVFGGIFSKTELSEVLTEITKLDHSFDKNAFLEECRRDIVPNILEAMLRGDLDILRDWCHEAPFNILSQPLKQAKALGYKFDSKLIDISPIEINSGKILEQGPVLVLNFNTQQIMCIRDALGKVIEGSPDKIMRMQYVWILCKDVSEMDPKASWKLLDLSIQAYNQWT